MIKGKGTEEHGEKTDGKRSRDENKESQGKRTERQGDRPLLSLLQGRLVGEGRVGRSAGVGEQSVEGVGEAKVGLLNVLLVPLHSERLEEGGWDESAVFFFFL